MDFVKELAGKDSPPEDNIMVAYGKQVGRQLSLLPQRSALLAKKEIDDVLFKYNFQLLDESANVN